MDFLNTIFCMIESILATVFGMLNDLLGLELEVPDLGCED